MAVAQRQDGVAGPQIEGVTMPAQLRIEQRRKSCCEQVELRRTRIIAVDVEVQDFRVGGVDVLLALERNRAGRGRLGGRHIAPDARVDAADDAVLRELDLGQDDAAALLAWPAIEEKDTGIE